MKKNSIVMGWELLKKKTSILAVHAILVPVGPLGKVLILGGDEHDPQQVPPQGDAGGHKKAQLYDVFTRSISDLDGPGTDVFCCGHAFAGDGSLIIGGGTKAWLYEENGHEHGHTDPEVFKLFKGESQCWRLPFYGPNAMVWEAFGQFSKTKQGVTGRWYPGMLTMPDGRVIALSGKPEEDVLYNHIPEISDTDEQGNAVWKPIELLNYQKFIVEYYPRCYVLPDGNLFICAARIPDDTTENWYSLWLTKEEQNGVTTWQYEKSCKFEAKSVYNKWYYASVLLPLVYGDAYTPRILICNDAEPRIVNPTVIQKTEKWPKTGERNRKMKRFLRKHATATLLPTGQVMVNGGIDGTDENELRAVLEAEIFTPEINWTAKYYRSETGYWEDYKPEHQTIISRNYHSVALLLPDGSVWTAGSSIGGTPGDPAEHARKEIEIFYPDYFYRPDRLQIQGFGADVQILNDSEFYSPIGVVYYCTTAFTLLVDQPEAVCNVVLLRFGSSTHAGNFDQRYILTDFEMTTDDRIAVKLDDNFDENVAPPGWYMVWILDKHQTPCKTAKTILLSHKH